MGPSTTTRAARRASKAFDRVPPRVILIELVKLIFREHHCLEGLEPPETVLVHALMAHAERGKEVSQLPLGRPRVCHRH